MKKILVACPVADVKGYCFDEWIIKANNLTYENKDIFVVDNSENREYYDSIKSKYENVSFARVNPKQYPSFKSALAKSHDTIREKVLKDDYDYLLHLESDVFPPIDIIERLIEHKKKIVGALYHIELGEQSKLMVQELESFGIEHRETFNLDETDLSFVDGKVKRVFSCGLGCILIHRSILEEVEFRYEEGSPVHPDSFFFADINQKGFPVYVDTDIYCEHYNIPLKRF
jgi:GT2 family glycosyltransferase